MSTYDCLSFYNIVLSAFVKQNVFLTQRSSIQNCPPKYTGGKDCELAEEINSFDKLACFCSLKIFYWLPSGRFQTCSLDGLPWVVHKLLVARATLHDSHDHAKEIIFKPFKICKNNYISPTAKRSCFTTIMKFFKCKKKLKQSKRHSCREGLKNYFLKNLTL